MARSICIFTGTRAEYNLLRPLLEALKQAKVDPRLLVSGTHLSSEYGMTAKDILTDGFVIDERVEIPTSTSSVLDISAAVGAAVRLYGEAFERLQVDCVIILGDRHEAFAAATAAAIHGVAIAHLHGGELTEGAIDDSFRHAITKMAHLHFTSTEEYRRRVIQLGENPLHVFNVGALGVSNALRLPLLDRSAVEANLGLDTGQRYLLSTFHPVTRESRSAESQLYEVLKALAEFPDFVTVFTGANADFGGRTINSRLQSLAKDEPGNFKFFMSLGGLGYLSVARFAEVVIGNSSSGIIEVPSLRVPSIDIGIRQKGRVRSPSVITCDLATGAIIAAIEKALSDDFRSLAATNCNPYEGKNTVESIAEVLLQADFKSLLVKGFFDQSEPNR
jgi:UDP-hydrolysing UDP-N-acetyl-D-glucosamine 2-epimerase